MADPQSVTDEDKPAIEAWVRAREKCWAAGASWRTLEPRVFLDVYVAATLVENGLVAERYTGQLTYDEFTARRYLLTSAERSTLLRLTTSGTRFRQAQLTDQFVASCNQQLGQAAMSQALQQMRAQMSNPSH